MIDYITVEPDFLKTFSCIGDKCRNNCCSHSWAITIDKKTYKKYKDVKNPKELAEKFRNGFIKRNLYSINNNDYGFILQYQNPETPWDMICKFHIDGLCEIHGKLGEDYLCKTCRQYPRIINILNENNVTEKGISISCEAVLKLLLDKNEPISFENITTKVNKNQLDNIYNTANQVLNISEYNLGEYYFYIKTISIAILQNRDYKFEDRMIHLAFLFKKIDEAVENKQIDKIEQICTEFIDNIESGNLDSLLEVKPSYSLQLVKIFYMIDELTKDQILNPNFIDIINANVHNSINTQEENYIKYLNNFNEFMKDKQHFIENIMVTEFHNMVMPLTTKTAFESIVSFASYFEMLRFFVAMYMGDRKELTENELIDIIAYYAKLILHKNNRHELVNKYLTDNDMHDIAHLIMMIKS